MQPLEKPIAKANTMITKRQIKELLEEAKAEAKIAHEVRHSHGKVSKPPSRFHSITRIGR